MFEDSLMESGGKLKTRSRYYTLIGTVVNGAVLAMLILIPLVSPDALPRAAMATLLIAPPPPPSPPAAQPAQPAAPEHRAVADVFSNPYLAPTRIPTHISDASDAPPQVAFLGIDASNEFNSRGARDGVLTAMGHGVPPSAHVVTPTKVTVSSGVMAGMILVKTPPQYPPIARATHTQGIVELQATISKSGTIENLRVVSGPPLLRAAALDAVRSWRYRPYLLNNEPVEVETQVNVIFNIGN